MAVSLTHNAIVSIVFMRLVIKKVLKSSVCILPGRIEMHNAEGSVVRHYVVLLLIPLVERVLAMRPRFCIVHNRLNTISVCL